VSVEANLPLSIREERQGVPIEDIKRWFKSTLGTGRLFTLDHFGSTSEANLLNRVRYMIKGLGCKWIILDHLSIVVSAMEDGGDERKTIDSIMTKLRQMCEETNAGIHLVSHLRRVEGNKGHEQGVEVSLSHLRGSQAIAQLSDAVIAAERNQQADNKKEANLTRLRVLKNRYAGLTGLATNLAYIRETGRLQEVFNVEEWIAPDVDEAGC
jgi:twinkle protein